MKRKKVDKITEAIKLAARYGMTYGELQQKESLGLLKIFNGRLLIKVEDHWEVRP